ncbi:MAG: sulfite exporter TauE/SafE family protein [Candidatus Thermoplasmatota archaeon]|nr:sulfite exporter TauE/SafE family protein [Candidatus Thermoplasmatota archaeon]
MMSLLWAVSYTLAFFLSGAVISVLGSMTGLGGGFLAVPYLVLFWRFGRQEAVLSSFVLILGNSISSSFSFIRSSMVNIRLALLIFALAAPSMFLGYFILEAMDSSVFDISFASLLLVMTILILRRRKIRSVDQSEDPRFSGVIIPTAVVSFITGTLSSMFGIGGGAILMPYQMNYLKVNVKRAVATSMTVIALMSLFRIFVVSGGVFDHMTGIPFMMGAMVGGQLGVYLVRRLKGSFLLYLLAAFLFLISLYMGVGGVFSLLR